MRKKHRAFFCTYHLSNSNFFNTLGGMRNNDPIFYPDEQFSAEVKRQRDRNYNDCINVLQTQWWQADMNQRCAMGDQEIWGLLFPGVSTYKRKIFNFNIVQPIVQAITGHQRQSRKSTIVIPISRNTHENAQKTADQMTKTLFHILGQTGVYQTYSDAFEQGAVIQGMGWLSHYIDRTQDPISGDVRVKYIDMKSCLWDPFFRDHSASDMRFFEHRQFFGQEEAATLYPDFADAILSLPKGGYRDDRFYYMPEVYQIQQTDLIAFDEYWYKSSREATFLVDIKTEEVKEFDGPKEDLDKIMHFFKKELRVIKQPKPTVRRSIILNDRVLIDEPDPNKIDRYPYVPVLSYFTADTPYYSSKFRSPVSDLRDVAYLFNRLKVANLDILEAQQQGIKVKAGALITPEDGLNKGHGRMLVVAKGASMDDVQTMSIVPPSPVMLQMEDMLKEIAHNVVGVDPSAMGLDVDDKAGIITMMRAAATARNLQRLFDQFDEAQRVSGDIIIAMVQENYTFGKIRQITGEEPTEEFDDKAFFKYGSKVIQGVLTETQQQLELAQLLGLQERVGEIFPMEEIIEVMTIQNKDRIIEKMQKANEQKNKQQEAMHKLQLEQMQIDNMAKLSYARSQDGLSQERVAKITTDRAIAEDKLSRAHQEDTHALLNMIKTLKELQGMDLNNLMTQVQVLNAVKAGTSPEEFEISEKVG